MSELLAPAGNMEAFKAAIANGCNAVYLGMQKFGARAYSSNFDEESLKEAVEYAHLRDVKVYVTMNTIVFDEEFEDMEKQLDFLNETGVDGVIVQDMAVFNYIADHFKDMEAHCSTQMGIDDLEGTLLLKELGAKRVVLSREVPIEKVKEIRRKADVPIEIFIHGALCISYSGNCLMSGMTGNRLGNRGRCIGSCRKLYDVMDAETGELLGQNYILSTKDLNTIEYADQLKGIDSLKIEGRMKEHVYVANVVSRYRKALDGKAKAEDLELLNHTFNRTFTKGYLFHEDKKDITNIEKPNNYGYRIGRISGSYKGMYEITLDSVLNQNDIIRIRHNNEDVNLSTAKLYDEKGNLINKSDSKCYIKIKERLSSGDPVYKTRDTQYNKVLEGMLEGEFKRFPLDESVYAYPGAPLVVDARGLGGQFTYESEEILSEALNAPTDKNAVVKQLSRLGDTVFRLGNVDFEEYNAFIPAKMLNEARKAVVGELYRQKLESKQKRLNKASERVHRTFEKKAPYLTAYCTTQEQYDACIEAGLDPTRIYFGNVIRRNENEYKDMEGQLLVGGLGGIYRYRNTNPFVTDYSLNITNSRSCACMHELGAERVTLSYEINEGQLKDLLRNYEETCGGSPALEMIVYGRAPLLFTKYCPLKKMNQCGICKTRKYEIKDDYGTFPVLPNGDCTTTILNGKLLNLLDEMPGIEGVEAFRLNFTIESASEVKRIVRMAQGKLEGSLAKSVFDPKTDTRGHFNKEIV